MPSSANSSASPATAWSEAEPTGAAADDGRRPSVRAHPIRAHPIRTHSTSDTMTMTTTDSAHVPARTAPIRPRGAARRAANDAVARSVRVGHQPTGAAVPPPAAPVSTSTSDDALSGQALPSRRDLRDRRRKAVRPGRPRTRDLRVPDPRRRDRHVPDLRRTAAVRLRPAAIPAERRTTSARLLPVTASALAACLVVSVSTPAAALDDPIGLGLGSVRTLAPAHQVAPAPDQHYRVASGVTVTVTRDGFDVQAARAGSVRHDGVRSRPPRARSVPSRGRSRPPEASAGARSPGAVRARRTTTASTSPQPPGRPSSP